MSYRTSLVLVEMITCRMLCCLYIYCRGGVHQSSPYCTRPTQDSSYGVCVCVCVCVCAFLRHLEITPWFPGSYHVCGSRYIYVTDLHMLGVFSWNTYVTELPDGFVESYHQVVTSSPANSLNQTINHTDIYFQTRYLATRLSCAVQ